VKRFGPRPVLLRPQPRAAARAGAPLGPAEASTGARVALQPQDGTLESEYRPVIDFWFRELTPRQWFMEGGPQLDERVRNRFGALVEAARRGALDHWATTARGRLALIIVLDQFPRHCFRGLPEAYAGDTKAQAIAVEGIEAGMDEQLDIAERQFFYLPLMHAEDRDLQALSLERFEALREAAESVVGFASGHRKLVYRFGRFPHRNKILGRASSPEEEAFLASDENLFR
jgi:uncharacterized protein (DUF924 family)